MDDCSPRWPTGEAMNRLNALLHLKQLDRLSQDWELEVADATRVAEFSDAYEERVLDQEGRFALMCVIVFSYDDYLNAHAVNERDSKLEDRVRGLLTRDFSLHRQTIEYWCCYDVESGYETENPDNPDRMFKVTPLMRRIWNQCN